MNNVKLMERLGKVLNDLYNTLDELDDLQGNEITKAESMILQAAMSVDSLIDDLDDEDHLDGTKSGAY